MIEIDRDIFKAPLEEVMENITAFSPKFNSVLNLETHTREVIFGDGNDLFRKCLYCGVDLHDMAWSGIFPPKMEDVGAALFVLRNAARPIVFGCRAARERAGFLLAVYRMQYLDFSFEHAYSRWKSEGCRWPTYWLWKNALKKWERK